MSDETLTRRIVGELAMPPDRMDVIDRVWDEIHVRERRAARAWRRTAVLSSVLLVGAVSAAAGIFAAVGSSTTDITLRCTVPPHAGVKQISAWTLPVTPGRPDPTVPFPGMVGLTAPGETSFLAVDTGHAGYLLDRTRCKKVAHAIPLTRSGLPATGRFTNKDFKGLTVNCRTSGPLIFRIRLTQGDDELPTKALLAVRIGKKQSPVAFFDWTPRRAVTYATSSPSCDVH